MYALRPPRFDQLMRSAAIGTRGAYLEHARKATGPLEDWHEVGAADEPAYHPDWRGGLRFRKDNEGFVYLVGYAARFRHQPDLRTRNWSYTFGAIYVLPPGYRPQYPAYIGVTCYVGAFDFSYHPYPGGETREKTRVNVAGDFVVEPDGRVRPIYVFDAYFSVNFESLAFRAAAPVL